MPPLLKLSGNQMIGIGFVLVLLGAVIPFLMVLGYIEVTFFSGFLTYGLSVVGLMLGVIGAAIRGVQSRLKEDYKRKAEKFPEEYPELYD